MGLSQISYITSWIFYFILNGLLITIIMMLVAYLFIITDDTIWGDGYGFWNVALLYFLYTVSNIGFVLILCIFFNKAKTGSMVQIL